MAYNDSRIVYLEISSWRGMSIGAQHFYGHLVSCTPYRKVELKRKLNKRSAQKLTDQRLPYPGAEPDFVFRSGYEVNAFESEDHVRRFAIRNFKRLFPNATLLIEGNPAYHEAHRVLVGSESFKKYSKDKITQCEKLGWLDKGNEDEVDKITDDWYQRLDKELRRVTSTSQEIT